MKENTISESQQKTVYTDFQKLCALELTKAKHKPRLKGNTTNKRGR